MILLYIVITICLLIVVFLRGYYINWIVKNRRLLNRDVKIKYFDVKGNCEPFFYVGAIFWQITIPIYLMFLLFFYLWSLSKHKIDSFLKKRLIDKPVDKEKIKQHEIDYNSFNKND